MDVSLRVRRITGEIKSVCIANHRSVKQSKREFALSYQLIRSGAGIGVKIREATYAYGYGKAGFIAPKKLVKSA